MGRYASERDGDYYTCACGDTIKHSYLLSSSDGYISDCCKEKGWDYRTIGIGYFVKKPSETWEDVEARSRTKREWFLAQKERSDDD